MRERPLVVRASGLFVVAGEASGDSIAAATLEASRARGFEGAAWGVGGGALAGAGASLEQHLSSLTVTGVGDALSMLPRLARLERRLKARLLESPPRAALLVDFTEVNARLGRFLREIAVPVVWCVAPQIWAWRPGRAATLGASMSRLGVLFRFEVPLWRRAGVDATWVGHPALDRRPRPRGEARSSLGLGGAPALALLPGSRPNEVKRLLPHFLEATVGLRSAHPSLEARVLLAPSLPAPAARWASELAARAGVATVPVGPSEGLWPLLPAFDAALCASGTASLEAALVGVPPVVAYRLDWLSSAVARALVRVPHVALPNVLLGRRAFPERMLGEARASVLARDAEALLSGSTDAPSLASELRAALDVGDGRTMAERVASLLVPWLSQGT